jgi:hypothetical protein
MRAGLRLPALVVTLGLLAGCSDPAGAARREAAAARKSSPSASPTATAGPAKRAARARPEWRQAAGTTRTAHGLRVRTGAFADGRIRVVFTDVAGHATRTADAAATPQTITVGRYTLTGLRAARSRRTATYAIVFHYRRR